MSATYYNLQSISEMLDHDEKEIKGMVQMFIEHVPLMMNDLRKAVEAEQWEEAGRQAHKLKSTIRIWQVESIYDDIFFVEVHGKSGDQIPELIEKSKHVLTVLDSVIQQLNEEFDL